MVTDAASLPFWFSPQVNNMPMMALVNPVYDCLFQLAQPESLSREEEVSGQWTESCGGHAGLEPSSPAHGGHCSSASAK